MQRLRGAVQSYAWGSASTIPEWLGVEPDGRPQAELWFGTHPRGRTAVAEADRSLAEIIGVDLRGQLGAEHDDLPFLVKLLAVERPLSIQTHPDRAQAQAGFAREQKAKVAVDDPRRLFPDPNPKPELVCALDWFEALCGFRAPEDTLGFVEEFRLPALAPLAAMLGTDGAPGRRLHQALRWALAADVELVHATAEAARRVDSERWHADAGAITRIAAAFPDDPGVVVALLLRRVELAAGDALYLPAGNLHAYLRGTAVEIMANSDNVVRGGLTVKTIDRPTLLEIVDTGAAPVPVQARAGTLQRYRSDAREFSLVRVEGDRMEGATGPAVLMVTRGPVEVRSASDHAVLGPGEALWVAATDGAVSVDAGSGLAHFASVGTGTVA